MERRTPSVAELVRRAVEVCDPAERDASLGRLEELFEDDDEPVTAVENLDERLALGEESVDAALDTPAVAVAIAIVRYLATRPGAGHHGDDAELLRLATRAEWHGDPPTSVAQWLAERSVRL